MPTGIDLSLSGLASGFDWHSFIDQMISAERAPESALRSTQSAFQQRNAAFSEIKTRLTTLQTRLNALNKSSLFDTRAAQLSDSTAASVTAGAGTPVGTYNFNIIHLATSSRITGTSNIGSPLSATGNVSGITLGSAAWPTPLSPGTFTVNNHQITIALTDSLQDVFDKIAAATNNQVTASYDPATDKITLSSSATNPGPIVLGSASDTSNFLQAARLNNNGTGTVTSTLALGSVALDRTLNSANLATAVSDGGNGAGEFKLNGVSISYNAGTDTLSGLIERINNSAAGVTASYDRQTDRFILTSKATGDLGITLEDVSGNFLAAAGLSPDNLSRGQDLAYTLNGGDQLTSHSNTITESSSGISGLSLTALKENAPVSVTISSDTTAVRTAIQSFIDAYNDLQSFIGTQTASSTDSNGEVTAGLLSNDGTADDIASTLRKGIFRSLSGLTGTMKRLADLGYQTNGYDNKITLSDSAQLDSALANNLSGVKQFFTDATNGLGAKLGTALTHILGDDGSLKTHQDSFTRHIHEIDAQIARMEKTIAADKARLTQEFIAMETAEAQINQQLQYLTQAFK